LRNEVRGVAPASDMGWLKVVRLHQHVVEVFVHPLGELDFARLPLRGVDLPLPDVFGTGYGTLASLTILLRLPVHQQGIAYGFVFLRYIALLLHLYATCCLLIRGRGRRCRGFSLCSSHRGRCWCCSHFSRGSISRGFSGSLSSRLGAHLFVGSAACAYSAIYLGRLFCL